MLIKTQLQYLLITVLELLTRSSAVAVIADRTIYRAYGAPYEYR